MSRHFTLGRSVVKYDCEFRYTKELGDRIAVSSSGHVLTRTHREFGYRGTPRGNGYFGVTVQGRSVFVHRLVYELFVGPIPDGMQIDHIDGTRDNNSVDNLRVVSQAGNTRNPVTYRRALPAMRKNMAKAIKAKSKPVLQVETGRVLPSIQEAARVMHVRPMCIHAAIKRQGTSAGFHWRYAHG